MDLRPGAANIPVYQVIYLPVGRGTRIRTVSRRSVPSVDGLRALADRPPTHPLL